MNLGILVLLIAIILFAVLAFKQISALILAPLVTIFVLVFSAIFASSPSICGKPHCHPDWPER